MIWFVAFVPADRPRHCLAFGFDPRGEVWIRADPCGGRLTLTALKRRVFDRWVRRLSRKAAIYRVRQAGNARLITGCPCVAEVKRITGCGSGALFPGGLRRDLVRNGATRAFR